MNRKEVVEILTRAIVNACKNDLFIDDNLDMIILQKDYNDIVVDDLDYKQVVMCKKDILANNKTKTKTKCTKKIDCKDCPQSIRFIINKSTNNIEAILED